MCAAAWRAIGRNFPLLPLLLFADGSSVPPAGLCAIGRSIFSAVPPAGSFPFCRRPSFSPPVHPCHRPTPEPSAGTFPFCRRPSFSLPVHPRRRPGPEPAAGVFPFCRRPSFSPTVHPRRRPAPVPSAGVPPLPRRRPALFLPKCPVAKCQSAVPRRDPAILLTIWQRSPIGTTFVCFMASPVKEPAGKMKTNN